MARAQVFAGGDEEARRAARGIADDVLRRGGGQLDHELDDMARGAELAVLPGARDLPQHVFVEIALGVAVLHWHLVDHVHDLGEQCGRRDGEPRVLHVMRVGRVVAAERAQEREDVVVDHGEHFLRLEMLEPRPPQVVVRPSLRVFAPTPPCDFLKKVTPLAETIRTTAPVPYEIGSMSCPTPESKHELSKPDNSWVNRHHHHRADRTGTGVGPQGFEP